MWTGGFVSTVTLNSATGKWGFKALLSVSGVLSLTYPSKRAALRARHTLATRGVYIVTDDVIMAIWKAVAAAKESNNER